MKRLTVFCGHYGSGKTNLAVNYGLYLAAKGLPVTVADLDIVNPYFRAADSERELVAAGVQVQKLPFANSSVDLPSISPESYTLVRDQDRYAVLDIGGDDSGAVVLGRFAPEIKDENNFENLFVVNFYRPLTRTAAEAFAVLREIEAASHLPFTGIVNNSNLGEQTTAQTVIEASEKAEALANLCGLPLKATAVRADLADALCGLPHLYGIKLQQKYW